MAYLNVVAVASGRPDLTTNSILISVTDGDTGDPVVGLKAKAFEIYFYTEKPTISQLQEWKPGIYSMNLKWPVGVASARGFHKIAAIVTKGGGRARGVVRGQTVCFLAVTED